MGQKSFGLNRDRRIFVRFGIRPLLPKPPNHAILNGRYLTAGRRCLLETAGTVTVLGARGSFPVTGKDYLEYGGNTSCFLADLGGETVILDAGSGLASLGEAVPLPGGRRRVHVLLSHLHLDHIMGLFTFPLLHDPAAEICLYGDRGLRSRLGAVLGPPYWPLGLEDFRARVEVRELAPGARLPLGDGVTVSTLRGNHPGDSLLYRLEGGGKTLVYALDCEMEPGMRAALARFAQNADLLIWDAAFAPGGLKKGWGHSTWQEGLALGDLAGVKRVMMTHYSQTYSDRFLSGQEKLAAADSRCLFAKEGMVVSL